MEGLKSKIPKPQDRSRHIIENMLYMVELDATNVAVSRSIFCEREDGDDINGNISQQDFLAEALPRDWPKVFDVIMGNPPYQSLWVILRINLLKKKRLELMLEREVYGINLLWILLKF
jgi:hypothetical protein